MNIDNWKEFKVGELFDATRGKSRRMQILEDGDIPLIAAARNNRGIAGTYNIDAEYENAITVSCNGVGCGSTFYHNYPFSITGDAIVLEEKQDMSDYIKQFIASIIDASFTNKYSYEEKCSADKAKNETILLPATPSGSPDWSYMEVYMKEMEEKAKERLDRLEEIRKQEKKKIDVSGWGEFHLYDLFDISMGNKFDKSKMNTFEDDVNFVGRSALNNGVACSVSFVKDKNGEDITPYKTGDITIALGGSIGSCFIQDRDFYTSQNVCVLINDDMNEYVKKFIVTSIYASCANYEAFVDELNRHIKTDFIIKLPVTSAGDPDWAYTEQYMREMEEKARKRLERLVK